MTVNINWGMAQPTNYSNALLSGMQAGRQNAAEQHAADAMTAFQADPTNAAAMH